MIEIKGASLKGSVIHKQGSGDVHHFVRNMDWIKDVTKWAQKHFIISLSVNTAHLQKITLCFYLRLSSIPTFLESLVYLYILGNIDYIFM